MRQLLVDTAVLW